jgi:hypothetical protein
VKRRDFLQLLPIEAAGAAAAPLLASGQHPGFAKPFADGATAESSCRYAVEDGAITITNGEYFNNRPLYCAHIPAAALGGDRPLIRLITKDDVAGVFVVGVLRGEGGRWLHACDRIRMQYRCGHITWRVEDKSLLGMRLTFEMVPFEGEPGFAAKLTVNGAVAGDRLVWAFGGAHELQNAMWAMDPVLMPQEEGWREQLSEVLRMGFEADRCRGNVVEAEGATVTVAAGPGKPATRVRCSAACRGKRGDALRQGRIEEFVASDAGIAPLGFGVAELETNGASVYWAAGSGSAAERTGDPARAFADALAAVQHLGKRVVVETPEPRLDAAVNAALHGVDAIHYPPVYHHGGMAWNVRLPGWRTMYGGTAFGWHERVREQGKFYMATQVKESPLSQADADPARRLCEQSAKSRLHGIGRIPLDAGFYDFQSQMFDQLIHAWRWTGSEELERDLRGALELHAVWMRECFDPDGDGLYESYINTWPTDSVWYNGGGTVEETCYAYSVHRALADMAGKASDRRAEVEHRRTAERIRMALMRVLWVKGRGHFASYIEQGGHRRVHEDAWLYSQFLPIDAELCSREESAQALHYTEWALENVRPAFGGRRVWTSNWVPSKWSVREIYHGDNYHLALAHFQSGLPEQGWELLQGNMLDTAFARVAPGSQSMAGAGTDFGDILPLFCRTVVEGLFGYSPDRPNGVVRVRPALPASWDSASIQTPDFSLRFRQEAGVATYELTMREASRTEWRLPVRAQKVKRLTCNGKPIEYAAEPGFGCAMLTVPAPKGTAILLRVETEGLVVTDEWRTVTANKGEAVSLRAERGALIAVRDPQGALSGIGVTGQPGQKFVAQKPGHHLLLLKTRVGELERWEPVRLQIRDLEAERRVSALTPREAGSSTRWHSLDLGRALNGDIRDIHKQHYVSPRPDTVSVRIGADGYSPWTFVHWKLDPPEIDLSNVRGFLDGEGRVVTLQGARFAVKDDARNIAFTSLWDNWPRRVIVPVGGIAESAWLLVAGSTNPMQTRIANAVIRFRYEDGMTDELELIPPLNFWTLCPLGGRDYSYERDRFCLPAQAPPMVQLGNNCRAMVLSRRLRRGIVLESITLETLSEEVVIGLMAASLANPV